MAVENFGQDETPPRRSGASSRANRPSTDLRLSGTLDAGRCIESTDLDGSVLGKAVSTVARRAHISRTRAEDLATDAMVRLMRLRPNARNRDALLATTALNLHWSRLERDGRRAGKRPLTEQAAADAEPFEGLEPADPAPDAVREIGDREEAEFQAARLRAAMQRLRPKYRSLLSAYYLEDRAPGDTVRESKESTHHFGTRLYRAHARLRSALGAELGDRGES